MSRFILLAVVLSAVGVSVYGARITSAKEDRFPVSIIHVNDFHARYEETNHLANSCKAGEKCIGGFGRMVTMIKHLKETLKDTNPIYLNAGDNFQGTLWYSIGRWNLTTQFMNMLDADAVTLGNHEFDRGVAEAVAYLEHLNAPVTVANIDDSDEPTIQGKYRRSVTIDKYGRKIGVIGAVVQTVHELAHTEKLKFVEEAEVIRREAAILNEQGVDIIIALTHCGLSEDYRIARAAAPYVDVIVGGHSHTFMYTETEEQSAPGPDIPEDNYPAIVEANGHRVLIVQAASYAKYVGNLTVWFDESGNVAEWEGAPVFLDTHIVQDPEVMELIRPWKQIIDAKGSSVVGVSKVVLDKRPCAVRECNLGNFVGDAFVHHHIVHAQGTDEWTGSIVALIPAGAIRTTIDKGPITYNDLAITVPFENTIDTWELRGEHMLLMFEHAVNTHSLQSKQLLQLAGAKVVYNVSEPFGSRVMAVEILDFEGIVPEYKPLDVNRYYKCIASSFLAEGGDGFTMITDFGRNFRKGLIDIDVMIEYLAAKKIIYTGVEGRLTIHGAQRFVIDDL